MCQQDRQCTDVGVAPLIEEAATGMPREGFWALLTILKSANASLRIVVSKLGFRRPRTAFQVYRHVSVCECSFGSVSASHWYWVGIITVPAIPSVPLWGTVTKQEVTVA